MKIIAIIPARGGSKRLPNKNIRKLGDKSLLAWTVNLAFKVPEITTILVSTDSSKIAEESRKLGVEVLKLRPRALATDTATSVQVALFELKEYERDHGEVDGVLLLQPTSPFRSIESVAKSIKLYRDTGFKTIVGVAKSQGNPFYSFTIQDNQLVPISSRKWLSCRTQDLPLAFEVTGSIYLIHPNTLRKEKTFTPRNSVPVVIEDSEEKLDIDTIDDFKIAVRILKSRKNSLFNKK